MYFVLYVFLYFCIFLYVFISLFLYFLIASLGVSVCLSFCY